MTEDGILLHSTLINWFAVVNISQKKAMQIISAALQETGMIVFAWKIIQEITSISLYNSTNAKTGIPDMIK